MTPSEYTRDYTTLESNHFLGHIIDSNGYILSSYACGINDGVFFCLRASELDQSSLTYKSFYQEAVNRMNVAFPSCNATANGSNAVCYGSTVEAYAYSFGNVYSRSGNSYCFAAYDSGSDCRTD